MQKSRGRRGLMGKLSALTVVAVYSALGQTPLNMRAEIPFEFTVGSKALPAGTYTFSVVPGNPWLAVAQPGGGIVRTPILTRLGGPSEFRDLSLVFDKAGDGHILSEVWLPGTDGILVHSTPKNHSHEIVVGSSTLDQGLSGKAAYDQTCRRCHGRDGKGDESADRFFKMAIPRLSDAYVQSKSDAELRDIVTKGRRTMDPVRIDESGFRHLLPLRSVDAVIAYVRTLKQ